MNQLSYLRLRMTSYAGSRAHFGWAAATGLFLLFAAGAAAWWAPQLADEAVALQAQREAVRVRTREARASLPPDPADQMAQFRAWFPTEEKNVDDLRTLFRIAGEQRIVLARGDYGAARRPDAQLSTYDVVLPIHTTYAGVRAFVAAVLNALPHASLEEMRIERSAAGNDTVEARVHLTLYYRED
jgi:hypothetical protein